jgi:hypothetical protein
MLRAGVGERALIFCRQRGAPGCAVALDRLSRAPVRRMRALLVVVRNPVLVPVARRCSRKRIGDGTGVFAGTSHPHGFPPTKPA